MKRQSEAAAHGVQSLILRKCRREFRDRWGRSTGYVLTQARLSDIMLGKRRATPEQAVMLEKVLQDMGYAISKFDIVFAFQAGRPLLKLDKTRETGA